MAVAKFYLDLGHNVQGIFVDYGQKALQREAESSRAVAEHLSIALGTAKFTLPNSNACKTGFIQGRNLFLVSIGIASFIGSDGIIALGIHAGTGYSDCSKLFLKKSQEVCDLYFEGRVTIGAPLVDWNKQLIYKYCKEKKLPTDITYSCESGLPSPCKKCNSCKDRELLDVS